MRKSGYPPFSLMSSSSATRYRTPGTFKYKQGERQDTNRKDIFARNRTNKVQYLEYMDS